MNDHLDNSTTSKTNSPKSPLKAIREKCLDCCCYQTSEVRMCPVTNCSLWPYRFGKNPLHQRNMTDEQKKAATERLRQKQNEEHSF